jgi:hypothetical protein
MIASKLHTIFHILFSIAFTLVIAYYSVNLNKQVLTMSDYTTIQLHKLTRAKLKEVSDKYKQECKWPNKQTEILTDFINKLHAKEIK